ncbi:MAG: YtxH domain-containing protein [Candidatus Margulisiibacteriota bacterium]
MSDKSNFFAGVVLGAVVGAVAGILFAPASGQETRIKLKEFKEKNEGAVKEKTEELIAKTMNSIEEGFDKIGKMVDKRRGPNGQEEA